MNRRRPPFPDDTVTVPDSTRDSTRDATTIPEATIPEGPRGIVRVERDDVRIETPTDFAPPRLPPPPPAGPGAGEIRVISMKQAEVAEPVERGSGSDERVTTRQHKVQLRALSEVSRRHATPPSGLGYLAPPRDAREARTRRWRDYVVWGCAIVILGCAVMIGVWFLGR